MASILRPTPAQRVRRLIVLGAALFAVLTAYGQMGLGWGQTPAEFSADSDATLRVAGWAFSIWGVIYLGLIAYAVRQALPQTGESDLIHDLGWPSAIALIAIGLWIVAAALDWEVGTVVLIFAALTVLVIPLVRKATAIRGLALGDRDRWLTVWPLSLLAGWLAIAAPVNLITVATGNGDLPGAAPPVIWAGLAIVLVAASALAMTWRLRTMAFAIPVTWGLIGVFGVEQARNAGLAFTALIAAIAIVVGTAVILLAQRRRVERRG